MRFQNAKNGFQFVVRQKGLDAFGNIDPFRRRLVSRRQE
jgi:hypothetical protein